MADPPPYPGAPRWVKVSGIVVGVLALAVLLLLAAGGGPHRPGRYVPPGDATETPSAGVTSESARPGGHTRPEGGGR